MKYRKRRVRAGWIAPDVRERVLAINHHTLEVEVEVVEVVDSLSVPADLCPGKGGQTDAFCVA